MTRPTSNNEPEYMAKLNYAVNLAEDGQLVTALPLLRDLAASFPNVAIVQSYCACYLREAGQIDEAVVRSRIGVKLCPNSEKASLVCFHSLWDAGYRDEAVDEIRRFLQLKSSPEYEELLKNLEYEDTSE